jgi:hypothetical protein
VQTGMMCKIWNPLKKVHQNLKFVDDIDSNDYIDSEDYIDYRCGVYQFSTQNWRFFQFTARICQFFGQIGTITANWLIGCLKISSLIA